MEYSAPHLETQKLVGLVHLTVSIISAVSGLAMFLSGMDAYPSVFLLGFVCFGGWLMNRAGWRFWSSVTLIVALLIGIQYNVLQGYGIHDIAIIAWPALIFFSGLLFGSRAIPIMGALVMLLSVMTRILPNASNFIGDAENGDLIVMLLILAAFSFLAMLFQRGNERSMRALRESEEKYRKLFEQASDGIFYLSTDRRILDVNESLARMHGYSVEEMRGMDLRTLDSPETARLSQERVRRILAGENLEFEVEHFHRDGHLFPLEVSTGLIHVGDSLLIQAFHRDITGRKQVERALRESQELQSLFMRHSPIYTYIKSVTPAEDRLLQASDNLHELLGTPSTEAMIGRTMEELFPPEFAAKIIADDRVVVADGDVLRLDEDLGGRHYTTIKFPLVLGDRTLLAGYTIDITERKQAEEALLVGEERYHNLFNQSIVVVTDNDGRWIEISPLFCELVGYSQDELLGMSFAQITHPDDLAANLELNERIARGEVDNFILEKRYLHKSGKVVWANLSKTSVRDASGVPFQSVTVIQDITVRKEAEAAMQESESRFRAFVEQSPVAIGVFNLDGVGLYGNRKYIETLGMRSVEELIGRPAFELFAPQFREESKERTRRRLEGLPVPSEYESVALRTDGSRFPVHMAVAPIQMPGGTVSIAFLTDLTESRRAEEDRIARELADRANRAKSEFLSRMSHELRTPLNAILGFAQLLKMDELKPDQERGVDQINKSGRHLLNLVNEVLDIARIEAGKMQLSAESIHLEAVVKEALELIRPLAEARHISQSFEATLEGDLLVMADRQSLRQVLLNLLSNAVKYNREGGKIAITTKVTPDGHLRLQVKDTGQGIAPEKMERLFVPFDRLGMETMEQEGTGLGLALSRGLMEAMGGGIGAGSKLGEGSTFWLELKVAEE